MVGNFKLTVLSRVSRFWLDLSYLNVSTVGLSLRERRGREGGRERRRGSEEEKWRQRKRVERKEKGRKEVRGMEREKKKKTRYERIE
jgi:hypothetical protein